MGIICDIVSGHLGLPPLELVSDMRYQVLCVVS